MLKMKCKVVMLATDKLNIKNQICKFDYGLAIAGISDIGYSAQHLYFVSDEEIQVGDYYTIYDSMSIHKAGGMNQQWYNEMCKKVVATTDTSLNLPLIPQEFIQEYVESNGNIDEVFVEFKIVADDFINGKETEGRGTIWKNELAISKVKDTWNYDEHCLDMQYYMEYCQSNGYVTPQKWLAELKHY